MIIDWNRQRRAKATAGDYRKDVESYQKRFAVLPELKKVTQADLDFVENSCLVGLALMHGAFASGDHSYRSWFDNQKFAKAFRDRQATAFQKKWRRHYQRFFDLALSIIDVWPNMEPVRCPLDPSSKKPISDNKRRALEKARAARHGKKPPAENRPQAVPTKPAVDHVGIALARVVDFRRSDLSAATSNYLRMRQAERLYGGSAGRQSVQRDATSESDSLTAPKSTQKTPRKPGSKYGRRSTFGELSDSEKSPIQRWRERQAAVASQEAKESTDAA